MLRSRLAVRGVAGDEGGGGGERGERGGEGGTMRMVGVRKASVSGVSARVRLHWGRWRVSSVVPNVTPCIYVLSPFGNGLGEPASPLPFPSD